MLPASAPEPRAADTPTANLPRQSDAASMPDALLPIDVSPGLEFLATPAAQMKDTDSRWPLWRRHQVLESEPRDEAWAPRTESGLRDGIHDALMKAGFDNQRVELSVIECRASGCEIQAVGYVEDNGNPNADLQMVVPRVLRGPLAGEFDPDQFVGYMTGRTDGRIQFLLYMQRARP